jgi:protein SCO1/2
VSTSFGHAGTDPGGAGPTRLLQGAGFALFVLFTLLFSTLVTAGLLTVPPADEGLGAFARDFRTWCLGGEPAGGSVPLASVLTFLGSPLLMAGVVVVAWARPLAALRGRGWRPLVLPAALGLTVSLSAATGLLASQPATTPSPGFPAESLRTSYAAPDFRLTGHGGDEVSLSDLRGRVVVLTSVYAHCPAACPMILAQARRVVGALSAAEREDLTMVAVTMDPERDTPEVLKELARAQGLEQPTWELLTGPPSEVNDLLDRMGLKRTRDAETGLIDHANLFLVVDRSGRVAYRFALGDLQEEWLVESLRLLLAEPVPAT